MVMLGFLTGIGIFILFHTQIIDVLEKIVMKIKK